MVCRHDGNAHIRRCPQYRKTQRQLSMYMNDIRVEITDDTSYLAIQDNRNTQIVAEFERSDPYNIIIRVVIGTISASRRRGDDKDGVAARGEA